MKATGNQASPDPEPRTGAWRELYGSWRYLLWALALVMLVMLFYLEEDYRGRRAWERYRTGLMARGERIDGSEFVPPPVPDQDNFAATPLLAPLFEFVPGTRQWLDTNALSRARGNMPRYAEASRHVKARSEVRSNSWVRAATDLSAWHAAFAASAEQSSSDDPQEVRAGLSRRDAALGVLAELRECEPYLQELRAASRRPQCRFNIDYAGENPAAVLLPHLGILKHWTQVLQLRASANLTLGRTPDAFEDLQLMLYLADASRGEPILISHLVRLAQHHIALQPLFEGMEIWSDSELAALQARLGRVNLVADGRRVLEGERSFFGNGLIEYVRRSPEKMEIFGGLEGADGQSSGGFDVVRAMVRVAPSGWLYLEQLNQCRIYEEYLLPTLDPSRRQATPGAGRRANERLSELNRYSPVAMFLRHEFFSKLMLPSASGVAQRTAFVQSALDTASTACALERYRRAHRAYPESPEALKPGFLDSVPHDLINGQALKYRRPAADQYLLYSVGWNETDDGGVVKQNKKGENVDLLEGDWVWTPWAGPTP